MSPCVVQLQFCLIFQPVVDKWIFCDELLDKSMCERNTIQSAYTMCRHLE